MDDQNQNNLEIQKIQNAKLNEVLKQKLIKNWRILSDTQKKKILTLLKPAGEKLRIFNIELTSLIKKIQSDIREDAESNESKPTLDAI